MKTAVSVGVIFLAAFFASCLENETTAQTGGVSRAEFDALLARVAELEARPAPGDAVYSAETGGGSFLKATAAGKPLGTAVGFLPVGKPAHQSTHFSIKSASGYLYAVPNDNLNTAGVVGIGSYAGDGATGSNPVYFTTDDCSSFPLVPGTAISDYGASQGLVFRIGAGEFNEVIDNPAQYFYIEQGTVRQESVNYASKMTKLGSCVTESGVLPIAYVALPNDPAVTGVDSAPVAIPVTLN